MQIASLPLKELFYSSEPEVSTPLPPPTRWGGSIPPVTPGHREFRELPVKFIIPSSFLSMCHILPILSVQRMTISPTFPRAAPRLRRADIEQASS